MRCRNSSRRRVSSCSPVIQEARYLAHRARLGTALDWADVASAKRNDAAALTQLKLVTEDSYDFGVCAAKIAEASIVWRTGAEAEADSRMTAALNEWNEHQAAHREAVHNGIARDIAEIRNLVVRPRGDGILRGWAHNVFDPRRPPAPFVIVNPDISVKVAGAVSSPRSVYQSLPGVDRVIFLNDEQQAVLNDIVAKVDGTPEPDQSTGTDLLKFLNRFFRAERRVGGVASDEYPRVLFETYPVILELEFLDAERTKAAARIVAAYEGGTIILEKNQGAWSATALVNTWIS